jgi:DNA-binding NtrC family response regulator
MSADRKGPCVFVVDDEAVIATTLGMILKLNGFDTHSFTLPLEALRVAREMPPDLLITDVVMPLMSGIDLAIQIQESCPNCKVLLFSGQAATVNLLAKASADGHQFEVLTKPVHPADLLKKIESALEG